MYNGKPSAYDIRVEASNSICALALVFANRLGYSPTEEDKSEICDKLCGYNTSQEKIIENVIINPQNYLYISDYMNIIFPMIWEHFDKKFKEHLKAKRKGKR